MHILSDTWSDGFLDYHRDNGDVRIQVSAWLPVRPIEGIYFVRAKSIRLILNYLQIYTPGMLIRKVISRSSEGLRNKRFFSVGLGTVCESDDSSGVKNGTKVAFVVPSGPECAERVVLPTAFVTEVGDAVYDRANAADGIRCFSGNSDALWEGTIEAWEKLSGVPAPEEALAALFPRVLDHWSKVNIDDSRVLPLSSPSAVQERMEKAPSSSGRLRSVVYGLGNHAKTLLLPIAKKYMDIECVHEIDPTQVGSFDKAEWTIDSSPYVREEEDYDVYFAAGYHHTHADQAIAALERGAYAMSEKPFVTTQDQADRLFAAARKHPGKFFAGFHLRYGPMNEFAFEDLGVNRGDPINYQCIVFEVPLPKHHWYRWPNSGSRVISNGCHWLDHFLYMNGYPEVERCGVWANKCEDISVSVELANGAAMNMVLTHNGSPRIGTQDHIEMRANGVTVVTDSSLRYAAEGTDRMLRRKRSNRVAPHLKMYDVICRKIVEGEPGDSIESIERTSQLMLDVEAKLWEKYSAYFK